MSDKEKVQRSGKFKFLIWGWLIGVIMGTFCGWWFRPPSSFNIEELKHATETKIAAEADNTREGLADYIEELSKKVRGSKKKDN